MRKICFILASISIIMLVGCDKNSDMQWEFIEFDMTGIQATVNKNTHSYEIRVPKEGADFTFRPKKVRSGFFFDSCWQYQDSNSLRVNSSDISLKGDWFEANLEKETDTMNQKIILQTVLHVHIDPLNNDENVDETGSRKMMIGLEGPYRWADLLFVQK